MEKTYFADVILPIAIPLRFTYRIPQEMSSLLKVGSRIIVPFGQNKIHTAIVATIHENSPQKYKAKDILELLDDMPMVLASQIEIFDWVASYYMCTTGEVLNIALPSGLKISSQSCIQINPEFENFENLNSKEAQIIEILNEKKTLNYDELARFADVKNAYHFVQGLTSKRAIIIFEKIKEKYSPKIIRKVRLQKNFQSVEQLSLLLEGLSKPKTQNQLDVLMQYLRDVPVLQNSSSNYYGIEKNKISSSALDTLIKKGIFESFDQIISRFPNVNKENTIPLPHLTEIQQDVYNKILQAFSKQTVALLHGITGSGKTEIYINLIQNTLENGSQVLYLLPEIALTTQIVTRIRRIFGTKVGVYHSKFSDNERVEVWQGILSGKFQFIIGVRSSVFLPFDNLGLIIVDEEHESSYKQYDPAPRYHARDVALMIAQQQKAKVLLGSATPSFESFYHAQTGKYAFIGLYQRYAEAQLPTIELINIKKEKNIQGNFSQYMLDSIQEELTQKKQVIVFQNRRGFSPYLQCDICSWIGTCHQCDVSLTYHAKTHELRCHYCGFRENVPKACPNCGSIKINKMGYGTEKIEEELSKIFPQARIARMDLDVTRSKNSFQQIVTEIESGAIDILVGTQMIAKGLDFDGVQLVCIFDADKIIHFPDFRASEKAFQLFTQVIGRAGRRDIQGKALIQSKNPANSVLQYIQQGDYLGLYQTEIQEREQFHYPPFSRIIKIIIKHLDPNVAQEAAQILANSLILKLGTNRVLGPEKAIIERIRNLYLFEILIKLEKTISQKAIKVFIQEKINAILTNKDIKNIQITIDVDTI